MDLPTAIDILDVLLDEMVRQGILPVRRYEDMSASDREKLVKLLVARYADDSKDLVDELLNSCNALLRLHYDTGNPSARGLEVTHQARAVMLKFKQLDRGAIKANTTLPSVNFSNVNFSAFTNFKSVSRNKNSFCRLLNRFSNSSKQASKVAGPCGPFKTREDALADAQSNCDDDSEPLTD